MEQSNLNWITGYIWGIADDVLRDLYVRAKYRDVILPMTVLRRFDAVLEETKPAVLDMKAMLTAVYKQEIDNYSRGIVKDRNRLYWEDFKAMPTCYPPPEEQEQIVDAIDQSKAQIIAVIDSSRREIDLLNEYRTCLIADVVTGKLDVRETAANLPDQAEDLEEPDNLPENEDDLLNDMEDLTEEIAA